MPTNAAFKLALIQMRCDAPRTVNLDRATQLLREAARRGAQVACLPELFLSPYFCQTEDHAAFALAEPVPGPTTQALQPLAAELQLVIVASLFERRAAGLYHNTVAVMDADGAYLGKYRKMHIPDDPLYYEKFYFTPGDLGFRSFPTRYGRLGTLICWDQWFPEAARLTALQGADLLLYPTAIGWHPSERVAMGDTQQASWQLVQRAHAVANGCFVAAVNRIGHEGPPDGGLEFWGRSFVCDPHGVVLACAADDQEEVIVATIDPRHSELARTHWPFLRDRRIDAYGDLSLRYGDRDR